jgi:hypothetical protein
MYSEPMTTEFQSVTEAGISTLYHYQRYNPIFLADLLEHKRIYCATPGNLNDPWDCRPSYDPESLKPAEPRRKYLEWLHATARPRPSPEMIKLVNAKLTSSDEALESAVAGLSQEVQKEVAKRRIYCLTPHPDSILMWSHYAESHRGVCLEFDTSNELFRTARRVIYRTKYPAWIPNEMSKGHVLETVYAKSAEWSYEDEFRLLGIRSAPGSPVQLDGDYLKLPDGSVRAVILGCEADVRQITEFFGAYAPELPLKQAIRARNEYRLTIVDLG